MVGVGRRVSDLGSTNCSLRQTLFPSVHPKSRIHSYIWGLKDSLKRGVANSMKRGPAVRGDHLPEKMSSVSWMLSGGCDSQQSLIKSWLSPACSMEQRQPGLHNSTHGCLDVHWLHRTTVTHIPVSCPLPLAHRTAINLKSGHGQI